MADRGTGHVLDIPIPPPALDYSYNWVNLNYGDGFVPAAPVLKGGPGGFYIDFEQETEPEPPASLVKIWDGTQWAAGAKAWDGTAWQPLKVWDGTGWVT